MSATGPDYCIERRLLDQGVWPIAGVDEVGRGPLAGPVAAAAVILDPAELPEGVNDSKALRKLAREAAFERIMTSAQAVSVAFVTPAEIDAVNIRQATRTAMRRAIEGLALVPAYALIDGNDPPQICCPCRAIIGGDAKSLSIAAASVVAKVMRDAMMRRAATHFPDYGFDTNAGYGAPRHLKALREFGPTPLHRLSFAPVRAAVRAR